jgi:uncharacterized protein (TIGR02145 family)
MKTTALSIMLSLFWISAIAQDITISFQPKFSGTFIDSVVVLNQRTGQKVTLIGNESLTLTKVTGVNDIPLNSADGLLYPNPCNGYAEVSFATTINQAVMVNIYNVSGQSLATRSQFLTPGRHRFKISFPETGIYNVSVLKNDGFLSYKAVCLKPEITLCGIEYTGTEYQNLIKNAVVDKTLIYVQGDILQCSANSGKNITIIADSPTTTKVYPVGFYECIDPDKKSYKVVKIGDQVWMAENLAWLPVLSPLAQSYTEKYYYVFGYAATLTAAKATDYYSTYGVLYNWPAAIASCPAGWHLPSDVEWTTLTNYLADNGYGYEGSGTDIAKSLEAPAYWHDCPYLGTPGINPYLNNSCGFSGLPGGYLSRLGQWSNIGYSGYWWSSEGSSYTASHWALDHWSTDLISLFNSTGCGCSVRCVSDFVTIPSVNTSLPDSITVSSAWLGGEVILDGGFEVTERGVCYAKSKIPTIQNNKIVMGKGKGKFSGKVTGLAANTAYYVRAYAVNSDGIAYGEQVGFNTFVLNNCGTVTDYDGNVYKTVYICTQCWISENLKTTKYNDGVSIPNITDNSAWEALQTLKTGAYCWYKNDEATYRNQYGALYNWHAVKTGKLCPEGWHVPSDNEWKQLEMCLGMTQAEADGTLGRGTDQSDQMKASNGWYNNGIGTNKSGFSGLPGGSRHGDGSFCCSGYYGSWWSSTEQSTAYDAWYRYLNYLNPLVFRDDIDEDYGLSVRCVSNIDASPSLTTALPDSTTANSVRIGGEVIRDGGFEVTERGVCYGTTQIPTVQNNKVVMGNGIGKFNGKITGLANNMTYFARAFATNSRGTAYGGQVTFSTTNCQNCGTVSDYDGNVYETVTIGTQCWMRENLKTTKHNDGSAIPLVTDQITWNSLTTSGCCWFKNDRDTYGNTYGALYNWYAVNTGKLCPTGWHVPSDEEWTILTTFLGGANPAGGKMKTVTGWISPNISATNESGFTGLPGGNRTYYDFGSDGYSTKWWSSTEQSANLVWNRALVYSSAYLYPNYDSKNDGYSVRCVRNN